MISNGIIKTQGDMYVYQIFKDRTFRDIGYDIKQVLQGYRRTTPFSNKNVVATIGYVCTLAMVILKDNTPESKVVFNEIKECIGCFSVGVLAWSEFVRMVWDTQKKLNISNDVFDAVITHIESMVCDVMDYLDAIPGDYR